MCNIIVNEYNDYSVLRSSMESDSQFPTPYIFILLGSNGEYQLAYGEFIA